MPTCSNCHREVGADALFCSRCGMRTDARAVHEPEPAPAAELEQPPAPVAEFTEG